MAILDFLVSGLTLVWLWISTPNGIWDWAYWFSVTSFYKWLPGGHIRFFGFWMAWFRQHNSSLLWNFSFKFHVHFLCGCRQKPNDCQLCHFVMAALWFWTMFNCNPPIAHCHPLLWGGGILVDHWSTISSYISALFKVFYWFFFFVFFFVTTLYFIARALCFGGIPHARYWDSNGDITWYWSLFISRAWAVIWW